MDSNPIAGILFKDGPGTLTLTNPNNSHNAEMQILQGELQLAGGGRINNGEHWMPFTINGVFHDNSTMNQIIRGVVSGSGAIVKNNSGTLQMNGANTFTGSVTVNGGTLYANPGNAAANRAFSYVSGITINNGGTLRAGPNGLFGWDGTQEKPVVVNNGGTLIANGGPGSDVGVGFVTLNGGALATLAGGATDYGSFRFDNAADKLAVTADSTVSAENVKFGSAGAAIDISASKTLNFTGFIADTANGGISYLTKTGAGTLILAGRNTHSGATSLNAGTTLVTGSLGNSAVTVAAGATLGGSGGIGGATAIAGIHSPGTQSFGSSLGYGGTARLRWELAANSTAPGASDKVAAAGTVTIASGAAVDVVLDSAGSGVALDGAFWTRPRQWTVLTGSGVAGSFALGTVSADPAGRPVSGYGTFSLRQDAASVVLAFTPFSPFLLWQQANFGADWADPAVAGDLADPDHDGLANLVEYALGANPNAAGSAAAPQVGAADGKLRISFTRNTLATDVTLAVMAADSLESPWTEIASSVNGAAFTVSAAGAAVSETGDGEIAAVLATDVHFVTDPAHPRRFLRVEVRR
jgi:autotransporter-associated beta strand protein